MENNLTAMDLDKLVKVLFKLEPAEWHSAATETLWATPIGVNLYRLENSPFYAKGFSYLDIVLAEFVADAGFLVVSELTRKSGHSTYAIWVVGGVKNNPDFLTYWGPLEELGCTYEGAQSHLLSVDVPASVDVRKAFQLMQASEDAGVWFFQEQNYGHRT